MSLDKNPRVSEVLPSNAWDTLKRDPNAVLIDTRTRAEWGFVGIPDLSTLPNPFLMVEWVQLPDMSVNPRFVDLVREQLWGRNPETLLFLCRSGVRSLYASKAVAAWLDEAGIDGKCVNVATGFEGDPDESHHRGMKNGWKAAGLPWRQS